MGRKGQDFYIRFRRQSGYVPMLLVLTGAIAGLVAVDEAAVGKDRIEKAGLLLTWLIVIGILVFVVRSAVRHSLDRMTPAAEHLMAEDPRPVVLYLRAFGLDSEKMAEGEGISARLLPGLFAIPVLFLPLMLLSAIRMPRSFEEKLSREVDAIGPFVALSSPKPQEPQAGAARLQPFGEDWQHRIIDLLDRSRVIIMRTGRGDGLFWEVRQVRERQLLHKLILFFQFQGDDPGNVEGVRWRKFAEVFEREVGIELPDVSRGKRFVYFPKGEAPKAVGTLAEALHNLGMPVETNSLLSHLKAGWPGASNLHRPLKASMEHMSILWRVAAMLAGAVAIGIGASIVRWILILGARSAGLEDSGLGSAMLLVHAVVTLLALLAIGRLGARLRLPGIAIILASVAVALAATIYTDAAAILYLRHEVFDWNPWVRIVELDNLFYLLAIQAGVDDPGVPLGHSDLFSLAWPVALTWVLFAVLAWVYGLSRHEQELLNEWKSQGLTLDSPAKFVA